MDNITNLMKDRMIAFLPIEDIVAAFEEVKTAMALMLKDERVSNFYNYFEKIYVGELKEKRGRYNKLVTYWDKPLFDHSLWNVFTRTEKCLPRTNNYCETWHHVFSKILTNHPSVYSLIYALIKEQNMIEAKMVKLRTGITYRRKPKYVVEDERIKNVLSSYDKEKKLELLNNLV